MAKDREDAEANLGKSVTELNIANALAVSVLRKSETRVSGDISTVTGNLMDHKATMARTNAATAKAIDNVLKTTNENASENARYRGQIKVLVDANKKAAHDEVVALEGRMTTELALVRAKM